VTHTAPMAESDGTFGHTKLYVRPCRTCAQNTIHKHQTWESSCGGYEDHKYECTVCKTVYWIDGIDS
jgi:hypothetical protein